MRACVRLQPDFFVAESRRQGSAPLLTADELLMAAHDATRTRPMSGGPRRGIQRGVSSSMVDGEPAQRLVYKRGAGCPEVLVNVLMAKGWCVRAQRLPAVVRAAAVLCKTLARVSMPGALES